MDHKHKVRIAFGSCNNQFLQNNLWDRIAERDPIAFVWGGDAIYADMLEGMDWSKFPPLSRHVEATPDRLKKLYDMQKEDPSYRRFLENGNITLTGTIDDHDMGLDNGDNSYQYKAESGIEFMNFIGKDPESAMYQRAKNGHGVYGVTVFDFDRAEDDFLLSDEDAEIDPDVVGYASKEKVFRDRRVAIFVLDVRSNRTPWGDGINAWRRSYDGDFLGERQWKWFETALQHSDASVNIIVNGLQVHPFRHPNANLAENWAQFPTSRQRLYDTILGIDAKSPVLVSGDVHMAQLMRKDCWPRGATSSSAPSKRSLVEFTTSGMTHSWDTVFASTAKFHHTYRYYPMHILSKTLMTLSHWVMPMNDLMVSERYPTKDQDLNEKVLYENGGAEGAKQGMQFSLSKNFGEIEVDWKLRTVSVRAFGEEKNPVSPLLAASFHFDQLSGRTQMPGGNSANEIKEQLKSDYFLVDGDIVPGSGYICVNHRGHTEGINFVFGVIAVTFLLFSYLVGTQIFLLHLISKKFRKSILNR